MARAKARSLSDSHVALEKHVSAREESDVDQPHGFLLTQDRLTYFLLET
jgi:hypothetical protein